MAGELAEMMLDGSLCESCGEQLETAGPGFPRKCAACANAPTYRNMAHSRVKVKTKPKGRSWSSGKPKPNEGPCLQCGFGHAAHRQGHPNYGRTRMKAVGGAHTFRQTPKELWTRRAGHHGIEWKLTDEQLADMVKAVRNGS